jgi:hypothetical protein
MDEPSITGLLAGAMKHRLDFHPDTPDAYLRYCIGDQEPHSPGGELGNDRLRFDVSVIRTGIRPRLSFVFEAKRLRTGGFPIGKYVGKGGMDDFISGRYASACPEAAMIGLFQNRELDYWHSNLLRAFDCDRKSFPPALRTIRGPDRVVVLDDLSGELESFHDRPDRCPLRLFHPFLDCR